MDEAFSLLDKAMMFGEVARAVRAFVVLLAIGISPLVARAVRWYPLGPFGGDARAIAADPADSHHLYLGTEIGWLYESRDAGVNWKRVSQIAKQDDLVIDHILVDSRNPKRLIVGTWRVGASDGGIYISEDGGRTWSAPAGMKRQSVRSMARSDSNPQMILAGTLQGVFRSDDNGNHWNQISPAESKEIHEVESLAIDPNDPKVIYAGTWHLPWKTEDGGENWVNIKQGIIDDSDVFSIIIDPKNSNTVYLSACSGIYKSSDAAEQFHKIQGIPSTARRTRKLLQDPTDLNTVYAGTTEGLYKTTDAGRTFSRMTDPDVIVNDVYVDPQTPSHVLLATDRGGVLSSEDGGTSFHTSNTGFSTRQVSSFAEDPHNPAKLYVGVVNGKQTGGVFASPDAGLNWRHVSSGLHGEDVFSLTSTSSGTLLAGTGHGIFRLDDEMWEPSSDLQVETPPSSAEERHSTAVKVKAGATSRSHTPAKRQPSKAVRPLRRRSGYAINLHRMHPLLVRTAWTQKRHVPAKRALAPKRPEKHVATVRKAPEKKHVLPAPPASTAFDSVVYALAAQGDVVYAGTSKGLLRSTTDGHSWEPVSSLGLSDVHFFGAHGQQLFAAGLKDAALSLDGGATWETLSLPPGLTQIGAAAVDGAGNVWLGGIEGIFYSHDHGSTWQSLRQLYVQSVNGIYWDPTQQRVFVASSLSTYAFSVHIPDMKVTYADTGWPLRFVRPAGDHLIAATLFEGTVVQPVMVDTPFAEVK